MTTREAAKALSAKLCEGCSAEAYELAGQWYVVTYGTGEGTFAYLADCVEDLDLEAGWVKCDEAWDYSAWAKRNEAWDYSAWCRRGAPSVCGDIDVAIDYYRQTGGGLLSSDACQPILTDRDLEIIRAMESVS